MKWKSLAPKHKESRYRWIFPLVPKKLDMIWYWLEWVMVKEVFYRWNEVRDYGYWQIEEVVK